MESMQQMDPIIDHITQWLPRLVVSSCIYKVKKLRQLAETLKIKQACLEY